MSIAEIQSESARLPRQRIAVVAPVALGVVLFWLAVRGADWQQMLATARRANLTYIALALLFLTVTYIVRGFRWRVLLSAIKDIDPLTVFWGTMVGYLGNSFLPARAGEILRSVFIGQRAGISKTSVLATALTERVMDVIALDLVCAGALLAAPAVPSWLLNGTVVLAGVGATGIVILLAAPRHERLFSSLISHLPLPERILQRGVDLTSLFMLGLRAFQHRERFLKFTVLTFAIWSIDSLCAMAIARAFDLPLTFPVALLLLCALGVGGAIPSTPGSLGIYQFVAVVALTPFGFTQSDALVYIAAFQAANYAVIVVWGGLGLWHSRRAS